MEELKKKYISERIKYWISKGRSEERAKELADIDWRNMRQGLRVEDLLILGSTDVREVTTNNGHKFKKKTWFALDTNGNCITIQATGETISIDLPEWTWIKLPLIYREDSEYNPFRLSRTSSVFSITRSLDIEKDIEFLKKSDIFVLLNDLGKEHGLTWGKAEIILTIGNVGAVGTRKTESDSYWHRFFPLDGEAPEVRLYAPIRIPKYSKIIILTRAYCRDNQDLMPLMRTWDFNLISFKYIEKGIPDA